MLGFSGVFYAEEGKLGFHEKHVFLMRDFRIGRFQTFRQGQATVLLHDSSSLEKSLSVKLMFSLCTCQLLSNCRGWQNCHLCC